MRTLILQASPLFSSSLLSRSISGVSFRSSPTPLSIPPYYSAKFRRKRKQLAVLCSFNYGGWEDLVLYREPNAPNELDPLRSFLISVGIDDKKQAFVFLFGFASAMLVSRLRFSLMALFPVSVVVFVAGFCAGVAQSGPIQRIGRIARAVSLPDGKIMDLGPFLSDLDGKIRDLRAGLEEFLDSHGFETGNVEDYLEAMEGVRSSITNAKRELENSLGVEMGKKPNQKMNRKNGDFGDLGSDFVQFLGSLFQENGTAVKQPVKAKESVKGEAAEQVKSISENSGLEDKGLHSAPKKIVGSPEVDESREQTGRGRRMDSAKTLKNLHDDDSRFSTTKEMNGKSRHGYGVDRYRSDMLSYDGEINDMGRHSRFLSKQGSYQTMYFQQRNESRRSEGGVHEFTDRSINKRKQGTATNFYSSRSDSLSFSEEMLAHDQFHLPYNGSGSREPNNEQVPGASFQEEMVKPRYKSISDNQQSTCHMEEDYVASSSPISDDVGFNQLVMEASDLIKQARECLVRQGDQELADAILCRAASLLSRAVSMKPMSLLAVGQLGNTYLLHGELKLKSSQELRTLLSSNEVLEGHSLRFKKLETPELSRESVASVLVDVCEACEELLIEAGRKYRLALSIDGNDVRALYNWGLALSLRAQLIADVGPEAAFDADKVYLAAIDKFDAMASRSNAYAPEALFRWGVALQHRSYLRSHNSKEKIRLLQQAKSLFEDVLSVESNNQQVREALTSCVSELSRRGRW